MKIKAPDGSARLRVRLADGAADFAAGANHNRHLTLQGVSIQN
jgi:hypothetical protein